MTVDPALLLAVLVVEATLAVVVTALLLLATAVGPGRRRRRADSRLRWQGEAPPVLGDAWGAAAVAAAERRCRSRLWWRRLRAARTLSAAGRGDAIVRTLLDDPHPEVRAEAAAWVGGHPDDSGVARLVTMLDGDVPRCRNAAARALLAAGGAATGHIAGYLGGASAHRPAAALRVAAGIAAPRLLEPALHHCRDHRPEVRSAAASVLAAVGGQQAAAALLETLDDDDAAVRAAAVSGLGSLGHWPAAPRIATALHDPAWEVRRSAARSLLGMGSVGRLYLRRALVGPEPAAADIAQHMLDLADLAGGTSR